MIKLLTTMFLLLSTPALAEEGKASWYGPGFHGRTTASGERFDTNRYTAAHKSLPFGTQVQVMNKDNGKWVLVVITDRGPFIKGRVIDLSKRAAEELDIIKTGVGNVLLKF